MPTIKEFLLAELEREVPRAGQVVLQGPRHEMIQDTFNHWAHHRGQMTVYLRLMDATVPANYGPSADDKDFA